MPKLVGFSFPRCVYDIACGAVAYEDVKHIYTHSPSIENAIAGHSEIMWAKYEPRASHIARQLIRDKKIIYNKHPENPPSPDFRWKDATIESDYTSEEIEAATVAINTYELHVDALEELVSPRKATRTPSHLASKVITKIAEKESMHPINDSPITRIHADTPEDAILQLINPSRSNGRKK